MKVRRFKFIFERLVRLDRTFSGRLAGLIGAAGATVKSLQQQIEEFFGKETSLSEGLPVVIFVAFLLCAALLLVHIVSLLPKLLRPRSEPGRFKARLVKSEAEAEALQSEIVRLFFPRSPLPSRALEAQRKNCERLIGVFDGDDVVGYCALWPVTDAVGLQILQGAMTDDDLMPEHLVPTEQNKSANYIVIVGIGVLPEVSTIDPRAGAKLIRATKETLRDCYFGDGDRKITLIAIAYTPYGKRACEILNLTDTGRNVVYAADQEKFGLIGRFLRWSGLVAVQRHPICARTVSLSDVAWANEMIE